MASFMSDSLEKASENFLKLSKFDKLTALSRTLRDDPSCQLCSILVKYAMTLDLEKVEKTNLRVDQVPPLITLRQGIVVLSRQWKNELYAPILIEYKLRSRNFKNLFNTQDQYESIIAKAEFEGSEFDEEEGGSSEEDASEFEDEQSLLIKNNTTNCSVASNSSGFLGVGQLSPSQFGLPLLKDDPVLRLIDPRRRYSGDSELLSFPYDPTAVHSESATQINSGEITPTSKAMGQNESLYDWMRRETGKSVESWKRNLSVKSESIGSVEKGNGNLIQDLVVEDLSTNQGRQSNDGIGNRVVAEHVSNKKDENNIQTTPSTPQTKSMNLLDAHIIFEPLLSSLGLMPQQIQNVSLKNLGKNISVLANVDVFKIDIVESDFFGASRQRSRRGKTIGNSKNNADNDTSSPAFLCEKMYLQLDHKKVTDLQNTMGNDVKELPLYISRAQMRRHTSKYINFNIDIANISPKINMPLLRLLNQILTMHQNIRETNEELRDKKPGDSHEVNVKSKDSLRRHNKSSSNASSSSSNVSLAQLRQAEPELEAESTANENNLASLEIPLKSLSNVNIMPPHVDTSTSSDFSLLVKKDHNSEHLKQSSPTITLKSQLKNRPKSFAQKFRPNSRLAGMTGYSNIGESPVHEPKDSFIITSAPLERISEEKTTEKCWKTMYNLLELYSTMPTTKTVHRQSIISHSAPTGSNLDSGILLKPGRKIAVASTPASSATSHVMKTNEFEDAHKSNLSDMQDKTTNYQEPSTPTGRPLNQASENKEQIDAVFGTHRIENETTPLNCAPRANNSTKKPKGVSFAKTDLVRREHTPLIVSGVAKIHRTKLMATLSGLKLEGEITGLESSLQYKEKMRAPLKGVVEARVEGSMKQTSIVLLEAIPPKQQTVVKVTIGKSEVIHSSHMWKTKDKNSGTMLVELVQIDIPQHPVDLHSIVTRGTKELSSTLEEFKGARILKRGTTFIKDANDGLDAASSLGQESPSLRRKEDLPKTPTSIKIDTTATSKPPKSEPLKSPTEDSNLIKPFVMSFDITLEKLLISAALLPSLEAEYSMSKVTSKGVTGSKAKFVVDIPKHKLSFNTKLGDSRHKFNDQDNASIGVSDIEPEDTIGDNILPKEASIDLPLVHVSAAYIVQDIGEKSEPTVGDDGSIVIEGNYLKAEAEIGELTHTLTTDLLNHLVFVQKVFMKGKISDRKILPH